MKIAHRTTAIVTAALAATFTIGAAHAKPQGSTEDIVVGKVVHADLDLTTIHGKRVLDLRIHHLVSEACTLDSLTSSSVRRLCKQAVLDAVAPQVQKAVLKAEAAKGVRTALQTPLASVD
jgi:UrcA family protein